MPVRLVELDDNVTYMQQLQDDVAPVVLINTFHVDPSEVGALLRAWRSDALFMQRQPGFVSTQLHRGTAGSATFVNVASWESSAALRAAFTSAEFQQHRGAYPESTVASPHVFQPVHVDGAKAG